MIIIISSSSSSSESSNSSISSSIINSIIIIIISSSSSSSSSSSIIMSISIMFSFIIMRGTAADDGWYMGALSTPCMGAWPRRGGIILYYIIS